MNALKGVKVALFVVDEAHCISEVILANKSTNGRCRSRFSIDAGFSDSFRSLFRSSVKQSCVNDEAHGCKEADPLEP